MQMQLMNTSNKQPVSSLRVVKNFRKVIEIRDINAMKKELYQFLNLHCGFIAHYDINGFKSVYSPPKEFAEVFIRHFDSSAESTHAMKIHTRIPGSPRQI